MERNLDVSNLAADVQAFTSNVFLVDGDRRVLVDAGANFDVVSKLEARGGLDAVLMTHTHPDHVGNLDDVKSAFGVDAWGFDTGQPGVDHTIEDGETVTIGDHEYVALHTPGHKNDHLCFYSDEAKVLFAGDLIFQNGSFGRTDLEEGDHGALIDSIERVLETVDEDLRELHVGHGPSVTNEPYGHVELALEMARSAYRR
ncbi:MBL fold metallo-hydrolase [Haloarchaeobius sp. TZWWS8]|uniref:MBL fold metallo-hydrolase n=1 Tax=Haloarchaeobius sp. TZWWS8 TaxID=3446121 RepID=UPI003EBCCB22